jgi:hypothetical protein
MLVLAAGVHRDPLQLPMFKTIMYSQGSVWDVMGVSQEELLAAARGNPAPLQQHRDRLVRLDQEYRMHQALQGQ